MKLLKIRSMLHEPITVVKLNRVCDTCQDVVLTHLNTHKRVSRFRKVKGDLQARLLNGDWISVVGYASIESRGIMMVIQYPTSNLHLKHI